MKITEFFLNNKFLLFCLIVFVVIGGITYYFATPRNEDPGFKIRTAVVTTTLEGANAKEIDEYVTDKIEKAAAKIDEVENIKTHSYDNKSVVYVEVYEKFKNLQPIWDNLRRKIGEIQNELPKGSNVYINDEFGDVFGIIIALKGKDWEYWQLKDYAQNVKNELLKLKNVAKVELYGDKKEAVYLYYNNSVLSRYKLTPQSLEKILTQTNIIAPNGEIIQGENSLQIKTTQNFKNLEDLKNVIISLQNTQEAIKLGDILKIEKTYLTPPETIVKANGKEVILLILSMKKEGNILNFGKEVKKEIEKIQNALPIGIELKILTCQSDYVKYLTDKFSSNLFQSVTIVIFIIFLILGAKIGLIIATIIPLAILGAFCTMGLLKIGLDKITLSALIISLGILVDNAIVICEGIVNKIRLESREEIKRSAIIICENFQTPLFVASLSTSCAFLPIFLAQSAIGEYSSGLFKVIASTLLISWFLSITILPYLMQKFFSGARLKNLPNISKYFLKPIQKSLNNPRKTFATALFLFILSSVFFLFLPKIFFPNSDKPMFEIELTLDENQDIWATKNVVEKTENYLKNFKEIKNFSSYIGLGAPRYTLSSAPKTNRANYGMILVNTSDYKDVDNLIEKLKIFCNSNFANANVIVRKVPLGPPTDAPVEIRILGNDENELKKIVQKVKNELQKQDGVILVKDDWGAKIPKLKIKIDEPSARRAGISNEQIAKTIKSATLGSTISSYWRKTTNVPIIYKMEKPYQTQVENLDAIGVFSEKTNTILPLSQFAKISLDFEQPKIFRRNGFLTITVQAWIDNSTTAHKVVESMTPSLNKIDYPLGFSWEVGGIAENSKKGNGSIYKKIPIALGLILTFLIAYFNSIKTPLMILFCAFLSLFGANFGLFLAGESFGFMTLLGCISLVGIAMNNTIVLVDEIKKEEEKNPQADLKILIEKNTIKRVTPILLTATTTIGAMLPLWLAHDPMFSSLAVVIIFGLLGAIPITLFVVPSLYFYIKTRGIG